MSHLPPRLNPVSTLRQRPYDAFQIQNRPSHESTCVILQAASNTLLHSASDLTHFLACEALTALDLRALTDSELAEQKVSLDEGGQLVAEKGMAHEKAHLQRLMDQGQRVVDINTVAGRDLAERVQATQRAMADGADVVYQATLMQDDLLGHIRVA